ncbi:virulence factor TspB C-terminal domain-related protein [Acinetobacter haemolyticus]|uniref:virulence factor TspB C-terminal domain-related protein n=1 Tax=Acinetobacter haemolyticus TaxID=29430 RepID=UPI000C2C950D|nr:virulence factor TspB C-terminal domain-related protein [Acinetobacter haemolyticus]ATZ66148.1 hypothetical protein BSR56_01450 [Acinetobacter haemolyticus]NAS09920.1 hypothetical protein [Acinetobacter haemolyticus]
MKTIIKIFICLSLIYTPFFAFAGAAEKWEVLENNYDHSSNKVKIEARKITQSAANSGRYKVEIPVNANTLGATAKRMLWAGAAVGAITALVEGVGWIIDEGSKVIKKPVISPDSPDLNYFYDCFYGGIGDSIQICAQRALDSQDAHFKDTVSVLSCSNLACRFKYKNGYETNWTVANSKTSRPEPLEPEFVPVSDSELGNEILGNGTEPNSRPQPSPDIITDAYSPNNPVQDAPAPQQTLDALDNANPEPETEPTGETKPKPNTDTDGDGEPDAYDPAQPDKGTEFKLPNFCSWAPSVCDFFTVQKADNKDIKKNQREQIEQDKTFFQKVSDWFDWSQADDELPDNESPEIVEHVTPDLREDAISWGASCPADVSIPISMQGVSSTLVFSWSPWCQLLSIIKPAIVASAYIGAAFIVLGLRT